MNNATKVLTLSHGTVRALVLDRTATYLADDSGAPMTRYDFTFRRVHPLYGWASVHHDGSAEGRRIAANTLVARARDAGMTKLATKLDALLHATEAA